MAPNDFFNGLLVELNERSLVVFDDELLSTLNDVMPFADESVSLTLKSTRILLVQLAAALERAPVGRDSLLAVSFVLTCSASRDPGVNPRDDRACHVGVVASSKVIANLADRNGRSLLGASHRGIDLTGRRKDDSALSEAFRHAAR